MPPPIALGGAHSSRKRLNVILISLGLLCFHLVLASRLSRFSQSLRNILEDDDDDRFSNDRGGDESGSLGGVLTLLAIARFWSLCSAGIALIGIYAIHKSNLSLLRLFTLNTFLSIALDLFLLFLTLILLSFTSSTSTNSRSNSSSSSIATTLCQTLSNQNNPNSNERGWSNTFDWVLPDLLGLSLEQCEEKFEDGVILSQLIGLIAIVEGIRGVCGIKLLGYYTGLAKGLLGTRGGGYEPIAMQDNHHNSNSNTTRRKNPGGGGARGGLRVDTTRLGRMEEEERERRYFDSPQEEEEEETTIVSPSTSNKGKGKEREPSKRDHVSRILVLPPRSSDDQVPLLSLTPSTPNRTSFPPHPPSASNSASSSNGQSRTRQDSAAGDEKRKILVYQPVMMTIEEARKQGASEVQLSSKHSPRRTRSLSHQQPPPPTSSKSDRRSRSSTITPSNATSIQGESNKSSRLSSLNFVPPRPPPSPSSISTASSSRTVRRQDSEDLQLLTPTKADEVGFAGLLRGDLEIEKDRNLQGKKRA